MAFQFLKGIVEKFTGKPVDWDELEESLIRADLGVPMTLSIVDELQARGDQITSKEIIDVTREQIRQLLPPGAPPLRPLPAKPKVLLIVGVNGTGKTTSTAKLAHMLAARRHSVLLAGADTFRAAAIEQLNAWGETLDIAVADSQFQSDPAAVCYSAYQRALKENIEFLICDTAGRLHTKHNLMQELQKIRRTLGKHDEEAPHETFLVVDATTGTNALTQAQEFHKLTPLTGIIATKLDGSGKGGVIVAIQKELGIPTRFIGTGEKATDFAPFKPEEFVAEVV